MTSALAGAAHTMPGGRNARAAFVAGRERFYWHLLWPALIVLCVVTLAPTVYLLVTSFTPLNLTRPGTGSDFSDPLQNYRLMLSDARLHQSFWVQAKLSFWTVGLQLLLGLMFALLLNLRSNLLVALRTVFLQGFLTNALNPKVALFFLAFLPQFIVPGAAHKALAFVFLGLVFNFNGTLWNLFVAWSAANIAGWLRRSGSLVVWLNRTVGAMFVFFGLRLAATRN